jgi:hypothetical protein
VRALHSVALLHPARASPRPNGETDGRVTPCSLGERAQGRRTWPGSSSVDEQ